MPNKSINQSINRWLLHTSTAKCNSTVFTRRRDTQPDPILHLSGQLLKPDNSPRYLGVYLSNKLSWENHITKFASKAKATLNAIGKLVRRLGHTTQNLVAVPVQGLVGAPQNQGPQAPGNPAQASVVLSLYLALPRVCLSYLVRCPTPTSLNTRKHPTPSTPACFRGMEINGVRRT